MMRAPFLDSGGLRQAGCPDAGGKHHFAGTDDIPLGSLHSHYPVALLHQFGDGGELEDVGAVALCVEDMGVHQAERIHRRIRHLHGPDDAGVDGRLHPECLRGVYGLGVDAGLPAFLDEVRLIVEAVFGKGDEEAFRLLHAIGSDAAEYPVLPDAFLGSFAVGDCITGAAVEQAVVAAGCPVADVSAFYQKRREATQGAVSHGRGAGHSAADNYNIVFFC